MSKSQHDFVKALFNMETGLNALRVQQIGFAFYMIEASDGNTYTFKG